MKPESLSIKKFSLLCLLAASGSFLWCCAATTPPPRRTPVAVQASAPAPPLPVQGQAAVPSDGSLWCAHGELSEMFINPKAHRIGDLVTINIVETSNAKNKASTTTDRNTSMAAGLEGFFNAEKSFPGDHPFFNPFSSVKGSLKSQFEGTGETERSGLLTAYMTAQIVEVLPNGNFVIEGHREVLVNADNQLMTVSGVVRPRDISADNTVKSTYIADARISYSGTGVLNDRQRPGWLTRIMDYVWPF